MNKIFLNILLILTCLTIRAPFAHAENIDPGSDGSQYAWGENTGWINLEPGGEGGSGVTVSGTGLTGYAWGENIGWIKFDPVFGGVTNDGNGALSGYAWSENAGWINFNPTGGGVSINACGEFDGHAWGENIGWIKFNHSQGMVKTSWVSPIDLDAPVTLPDNPVQQWYIANVSFGLTATDCGHGVQEIRYTINGGSEVTVTGSTATINITTEGVHTLIFYAVDVEGNIESSTEVTIRIDKTAPAITIATPPDSATYYPGASVLADFAVTDGGSGVNTITPDVPDGSPIDTATIGGKSFTVSATDIAGNSNSVTNNYSVIADTIPPVITITIPADGASYLINSSVTVDFSVTDAETGVANVTPTQPDGSLLDTSSAGGHSFTVDATDNAGNNNSETNNYTITYPGNMDPNDDGSQYAWGENTGWINFQPSWGPGVTVTDTALTGMAWGENIGWINLSPTAGGGVVNNGTGALSGYAWAENAGWINFNPTGGGVTIDPATGVFSGYAWGENIGWINFSPSAGGGAKTSWRADQDSDGSPYGVDCDDNDPERYPGNPEVCDEKDNDCDLAIDNGLAACYLTHHVIEDYEQGLPSGWTVINNEGTSAIWSFDDPGGRTNLTGGFGVFAIADSGYFGLVNMDTELRTPVLDLTDFYTVRLEFSTDFNSQSGMEYADVDISLNGSAGPWTNIWQRSGGDHPGPVIETVDITTIAAGEGSVMIRFHYYGAFDDLWWQIDDVRLTGARGGACAPLARIEGAPSVYFRKVQQAYDDAGGNDSIQSRAAAAAEDIYIDMQKDVTFEGGYDCSYSGITGTTTINGDMSVSDGQITIQGGTLEVQ